MLNNVPLTGQTLVQTRDPIAANFTTINTAFSVNHVQYNDSSGNQGKHFFVEFPAQTTIPTTVGGEVGLYCQTSTLTSQPELVFSHQSGSTAPVPAQIVEFTSAGWNAIGWTRLPSGILLKWGNFSAPSRTSTAYNFPVASTIPAFNTIYNIQITALSSAGNGTSPIYLQTINSTAQFTVYNASGTNFTAYYFAIGI